LKKVSVLLIVLLLAALCAVPFGAGCGSSDNGSEPFAVPRGCNPLAPAWDCLLPFPSDYFLVDDPALPSGRRVEYTGKAVIVTLDDRDANPVSAHPAEGASHQSQILAVFPEGVDDSNLVFHTGDVFESLLPQSPTLLIEAETGEPVLHFAELDPLAETDDRRAFIIRPLVRLKNATRYVVAIHGLVDHDQQPVEAPEGFRRIRDKEAKGHGILGPLAEHYEDDIFPVLEDFGLERSGLQLAWDFTTQTTEHVTTDMLTVRDKALESFTQSPPAVTITEVTDDYSEYIFRRIEGTIRVPLFMESEKANEWLNRDAGGNVVQNGEAEVPFTMLIPRSVAALAPTDEPARLIQFGHGFFGVRFKDSDLGELDPLLDQYKFVFIAVDWWGMASDDALFLVEAIAVRPSEVLKFTDRVHQGMVNSIAMIYAAQGPLLQQPELQVGPQPLYDPDHIYFYGNSLGGVLGGTYAGLSPNIERFILGVGGAGMTFIMFRSGSCIELIGLIQSYIPDPLDTQKYSALLQTTFDRMDPITYAPNVLLDPLPDSPASRRILMHAGIGDTQVPNLSTHLHARVMGVPHLQPASREIPGLEKVSSPADSALVEFDFGIDPLPDIQAIPPPESNEVHDGVRDLGVVNQQINLFFQPDGHIEHTCDGLCDPE
jgi:hypothetical protein